MEERSVQYKRDAFRAGSEEEKLFFEDQYKDTMKQVRKLRKQVDENIGANSDGSDDDDDDEE